MPQAPVATAGEGTGYSVESVASDLGTFTV